MISLRFVGLGLLAVFALSACGGSATQTTPEVSLLPYAQPIDEVSSMRYS